MKKSPYRLSENLSGMKRLLTLNGYKYIASNKRSEIEDQVKTLVTGHKVRLIETILGGIPQYINYRFHMKIDPVQSEEVRRTLRNLQREAVSMDECEPIVEELMKNDQAVVASDWFYHEIDYTIGKQLWR